jgi:hypothetical protein
MNTKRFISVFSGIAALTAMTIMSTPAFAGPRANGTTLAASKDLNICRVNDNGTPDDPSNDTWRYYGNISVWQEGAVPTVGLAINDCIQFKAFDSSGQFQNSACAVVDVSADPFIPAYTPLESAYTYPYEIEGPALNGYIRNSATVTITNHSGHLGVPWGPNPKFTYVGPLGLDVPACDLGLPGGCAYSWGYWKNHRPGGNIEQSWPSPYLPTDTFFYATKNGACIANCGSPPNDDVFVQLPATWADMLDHSVAGNAYYKLAHQYIAAVLNVANGATAVSGITGPGGILELATNWFNTSTNTVASCQGGSLCGTQGSWAGLLELYNTGGYAAASGPAHCGDDDFTGVEN